MELAKRRAAAEQSRQFQEKIQNFVRAWNSFAEEYAQRGTFNVKKLRQVNQAWDKLSGDETWLKRNR